MNTHTPTEKSGPITRVRTPQVPEHATICARNIMTADVTTIGAHASVREVARLLSDKSFSAVPVIADGAIIGIVTDGDLLRRQELGSAPEYCAPGSNDPECIKSHGECAHDVMTRNVQTVTEDTSLAEIAKLMLGRGIKHVPVVRGGRLVGIVSRKDIVRALVARAAGSHGPLASDDDVVRYKVIETLMGIPGTSPWLTQVRVTNGAVQLEGVVEDETAREPSRLAIEKLPCVNSVEDHRSILVPY